MHEHCGLWTFDARVSPTSVPYRSHHLMPELLDCFRDMAEEKCLMCSGKLSFLTLHPTEWCQWDLRWSVGLHVLVRPKTPRGYCSSIILS